MNEASALDRFGEAFIKSIRDRVLRLLRLGIHGEIIYSEFSEFFHDLNNEEKERLLELGARIVDMCLHETMVMIEENDWIELRVNDNDSDQSLRLKEMDLQVYAFIWAEKYSDELLSNLTNSRRKRST